MRRATCIVFATVLGCGFDPAGVAPGGEVPGAGDGGLDAAVDAPIDAGVTCTLAPSGSVTTSAQLASATGGDPRAQLGCPEGQWPVAVVVDRTNAVIGRHGNEQLVASMFLRCGAIALADGTASVIPGELVGAIGGSGLNCADYAAVTRSAETSCPPGTVLVGFQIHRPDTVLWNDASLRCATLTAVGTIGTDETLVPIVGSGTSTHEAQSVACPAGTAVVAITPRVGCGIDGFNMQCSALACGG